MLSLEVPGQVAVEPELLVADLALVGPVVNVANPFFSLFLTLRTNKLERFVPGQSFQSNMITDTS
jgi:hypothetical protein